VGIAAQGAFLFSLNYILFYIAAADVTSGLLALVFSTIVLMNIFNGAVLFRFPVNAGVLAGAGLGLLGIALVFFPEVRNFEASRDQGLILPGISLRDMNGVSLLMKSLDSIEEATRFARRLADLRGRRAKVLSHAARFSARYARRLSPLQHAIAVANAVLTTAPGFATSPLIPSPMRLTTKGSRGTCS